MGLQVKVYHCGCGQEFRAFEGFQVYRGLDFACGREAELGVAKNRESQYGTLNT